MPENKSTWEKVTSIGIPAKIILPLFVTTITCTGSVTWYFSSVVNEMERKSQERDRLYEDSLRELRQDFTDSLREVKTQLEIISVEMEERLLDRYTETEAERDALWEAIWNPGHKVPNPSRPGEFIVVDRNNLAPPSTLP